MIKYEDKCVMCGMGCIDCGRRNQAVRVCDNCGSQEQLYRIDGDELCVECLETRLEKAITENFACFIDDFYDEICNYYDIEEVKE